MKNTMILTACISTLVAGFNTAAQANACNKLIASLIRYELAGGDLEMIARHRELLGNKTHTDPITKKEYAVFLVDGPALNISGQVFPFDIKGDSQGQVYIPIGQKLGKDGTQDIMIEDGDEAAAFGIDYDFIYDFSEIKQVRVGKEDRCLLKAKFLVTRDNKERKIRVAYE